MSSLAECATGVAGSATPRSVAIARMAVVVYDGTSVALGECLGVPLLTLDQRIARAPGIRCDVDACPGETS